MFQLDSIGTIILYKSYRLNHKIFTNICKDGKETDHLNDEEPPIYRICFDWEDSSLVINNLELRSMKSYRTDQEYHEIA